VYEKGDEIFNLLSKEDEASPLVVFSSSCGNKRTRTMMMIWHNDDGIAMAYQPQREKTGLDL